MTKEIAISIAEDLSYIKNSDDYKYNNNFAQVINTIDEIYKIITSFD